jgi:hypothetical protein
MCTIKPESKAADILSTILTCRPVWDPWVAGRQNAGPVERLIERHELIVNNNDCQPTRLRKNCRSIIDLTLSTRKIGALAT